MRIIDVSEVLLELGLSSTVTEEERAVVQAAIVGAEGAVRRHLRYDPVRLERTEFYPQRSRASRVTSAVWETDGASAHLRLQGDFPSGELQVQHVPIRSVASLHVDHDGRAGSQSGAFAAETLKVEGTDFWPNYDGQDGDGNGICRDGIVRSAGAWPTMPGTVKIKYVGGYTSAELHGECSIVDASPIADAVVGEAVRRAKRAFIEAKRSGVGFAAGPITSEKLGDYSYVANAAALNRLFGGTTDVLPESAEKLESFCNWGWSLAS